MNKTAALLFLLAVSCAPAFPQRDNPFQFNPSGEKDYKIEEQAIKLDYSNVEIINAPAFGGLIIYPKDRWKNWVARGIYIIILDIILIILLFTLPRNSETAVIISYYLSGTSFALGIWVSFFGLLLLRLKAAAAGTAFIPAALLLTAGTYVVLRKTRKSDISLAELKESFKKMSAASNEDTRLISVPGFPSDWPDEDFLK